MAEFSNPSGTENQQAKIPLFLILYCNKNLMIWLTILINKAILVWISSNLLQNHVENAKKLENEDEILYFLYQTATFYYLPSIIPLFFQIWSEIPLDLGSKDPLFLPSGKWPSYFECCNMIE